MWASAIIAVAIGIYRGGGGRNTVNLNVDIFACALGLLSGCYILFVLQYTNRPFDTPWISPVYSDEHATASEVFDDKTSQLTLGSGSIRVSGGPVGALPKKHIKSPSNTSSSASSSRSRARKMSQTRRCLLDTSIPVSLSPLKPQASGVSDYLATIEDNIVPVASTSESFFAASTDDPQDKSGPFGTERTIVPNRVMDVGPSPPQCSLRTANVRRMTHHAHPRPASSPPMSRALSRNISTSVPSGQRVESIVPPPPPPPPTPPQAYIVPGAWLPQLGLEREIAGCA